MGMVQNPLIERSNTSLIDWVETGHISLSIEHIFQWSKSVILKHIWNVISYRESES